MSSAQREAVPARDGYTWPRIRRITAARLDGEGGQLITVATLDGKGGQLITAQLIS